MNCNKYLPLIEELADNELDEATARKVTSYLATCPECAAYYENLKREKEAYSQFLFTAEPPADLWKNFQSKLQAEKENSSQSSQISSIFASWKFKLASFPRLAPAVAFAALLFAFAIGFALLKSRLPETSTNGAIAAKQDAEKSEGEISNHTAQSSDAKSVNSPNENEIRVLKTGEKKSVNLSTSDSRTQVIKVKVPVVKNLELARKVPVNIKKNPAGRTVKLSEEEKMQVLALKNLETESQTQIEKVELLLRSFRNASDSEDGEKFDVAYEKQQARRLLDKNSQLRQAAEFYGAIYTGELLSRVEPVLLDIANLDLSAPSAKKVQDIKERLRNQNLIASLQTY